ncbi:MAG: hypothetical protein WC834_00135 [Eubacteriales bacterium]
MDKKHIPYMLFILTIVALAGVAFVPAYADYFKTTAGLFIGAFLGLFVKSPVE